MILRALLKNIKRIMGHLQKENSLLLSQRDWKGEGKSAKYVRGLQMVKILMRDVLCSTQCEMKSEMHWHYQIWAYIFHIQNNSGGFIEVITTLDGDDIFGVR